MGPQTDTVLQVLSKTDFVDMRPILPPLMHTICLVYTHSKYYNTTARIIVLMQVGWDREVEILNHHIVIIIRKLVIFSLMSQEDFSILLQYFKLR